ncbi:unnamed protein product [Menidia menidia]|uniref:(Atlantic silverside) hypothetical protein n=1 Tax=Menidia menidia TaxID=238744 RepID=A0A8S4BWV9_9TELE|nr:unnamed protein product [Menidia menidia]
MVALSQTFRNRVDLQDRQMKDGDVSLTLKDLTIHPVPKGLTQSDHLCTKTQHLASDQRGNNTEQRGYRAQSGTLYINSSTRGRTPQRTPPSDLIWTSEVLLSQRMLLNLPNFQHQMYLRMF